jgi:hypothetical protein
MHSKKFAIGLCSDPLEEFTELPMSLAGFYRKGMEQTGESGMGKGKGEGGRTG